MPNSDTDAKQWVDYYGNHAHDSHRCNGLGDTRWREVSDRPDCPECCPG
jgi:hypothetical protein